MLYAVVTTLISNERKGGMEGMGGGEKKRKGENFQLVSRHECNKSVRRRKTFRCAPNTFCHKTVGIADKPSATCIIFTTVGFQSHHGISAELVNKSRR